MKRTALDNKSDFPAMVVETVQHNFYVYNCLKNSSTEAGAAQLIHGLIAVCGRGGFSLEKWTSNSRAVLRGLSG